MFPITAFLSFIFLSAYTPGPNNIMALANASKYGFKKAMRFCSGAFIGIFLVMCCCALFTTMLYSFIPKVETVMQWVGSLYILRLAYKTYLDKPSDGIGANAETNSVFTGALMQFINPKLILYGITALSTFILPHFQSSHTILLFVLLLAIVGFSGTVAWALFGSIFQKFYDARRKAVNIILALLLVYCAFSILPIAH